MFFKKAQNYILTGMRNYLILSFQLSILLSGNFFVISISAQSPPVRIYNTHGSADLKAWTIVNGTMEKLVPENVIVENGLIRLTFPCDLGRKGGDPVLKNIELKKGKNSIQLPDNVKLDNAIIVPISNGKNFPEDINVIYQGLFK